MPASPADHRPSPLHLQLLGPFAVTLHGRPLPRLRSPKSLWLLALLVLRRGAPVERDWLAALLWPDRDDQQGLRNSLTELRRALGTEAQRLRAPSFRTLALDLAGAEVDLLAFEDAVARGDAESLAEAVALYRGALLEGCKEEWVLQEREEREQAYLGALERLAAAKLASGEAEAAEGYLRRAAAVEPLRESVQRGLMEALAAQGSYVGVLLAYRELRERLHQELNTEPDAETRRLFDQIRAEGRRAAGREGETRAAPTAPLPPSQGDTLTFLFTDIEGSTKLWEEHPQAMPPALARHDALVREAIEDHGGVLFKTVGDQCCAAFSQAPDALAAAMAAQRALAAEPWEATGPLRVRMAVHSGAAQTREGDFFGPALSRVARLLAAGHGEQVLLSAAAAELARDTLPEGAELRDLQEHRLKDLTRPERIFQLVVTGLPSEFPALNTLGSYRQNLPLQLTSFIGREPEIAAVREYLGTTRLLTLTGSGGCGKTRLALQVAAEVVEEYAEGVWLVELAALTDPTLVAQTVGAALGVREELSRSLTETLVAYLKQRRLLLVLDNCEHLLNACAGLAEALLHGCSDLRVLATSREGLGLAGERTYRVPSLSLPEPRSGGRPLTPEELTQCEAVRLFVERAQFVQPSFAVTDQNAAAVAQVCQRLDGIPLAIELAAARVKALSVEKLNERLPDMFRLLTGGSRTALPRQQTLRALIDWSYGLLSEPERVLLRRLSVFAGGWRLEAAEAVCAEEGVEDWEILDLLTSLVEQSLVIYEEREGEGRYRLLETTRRYARERLGESGEVETLRGRHRDWYLELAGRAEASLRGPDQIAWLNRLEQDLDNLRAALEWSGSEDSGTEAGLRLAGMLGEFWAVRGYWQEGIRWLETLLARTAPQAHTSGRAKALFAAGDLAWRQGRYESATLFLTESRTQFEALGDRAGAALAISRLGSVAVAQRDWPRATTLFEDSLARYRELEDRWGEAQLVGALGFVALFGDGDLARAKSQYEESLSLLQEVQDIRAIARVLHQLGVIAGREGDTARAGRLHQESQALREKLGEKFAIAGLIHHQGRGTVERGEYGPARLLLEQAVALYRECNSGMGIAEALASLGWLSYLQGDYAAAQEVLQKSMAIQRELGPWWFSAWTLGRLVEVACAHGNYPTASALLDEALELGETSYREYSSSFLLLRANFVMLHGDWDQAADLGREHLVLARSSGMPRLVADALNLLGCVELHRGDVLAARDLLGESLLLQRDQGRPLGIATVLESMGSLAAAEGQPLRAVRCLGAAEKLRELIGAPLPPHHRPEYDRTVAAIRAACSDEAFATAWAEGRAMPLEQVIALALPEALTG